MRNSKTQLAQIIIWFLFIVGLFSASARVGTRYALSRKLKLDDKVIFVGLIPYFAQSVATLVAAAKGLGKSTAELSEDQILSFLKAEYSATPLLLLALALVKLSILVFVYYLSPDTLHRCLEKTLRIIVIGWFVIGVLLSIFQCAIPELWDHINEKRCAHKKAWWVFLATVNILTDVCTVILQLVIVVNVQISKSRKAVVLSLFRSRLLVTVAAIAQLAAFWHAAESQDFTLAQWLPVILNQTTVAMSYITACIPYLKPFMESLETGMIHVPSIGEHLPDGEAPALRLDNWEGSTNSGAKTLAGSTLNSASPGENKIRQTNSWTVDVQGRRR